MLLNTIREFQILLTLNYNLKVQNLLLKLIKLLTRLKGFKFVTTFQCLKGQKVKMKQQMTIFVLTQKQK